MVQWRAQCKVESVCLCCQCISPPFSVQRLGAHIGSSDHIPDCSQVPAGGSQLGSCSREYAQLTWLFSPALSWDGLYRHWLCWLYLPLCRTVFQCHPRTLAHNTQSQHVIKIPLWWLQLSLLFISGIWQWKHTQTHRWQSFCLRAIRMPYRAQSLQGWA